jgi:hypothetical protein
MFKFSCERGEGGEFTAKKQTIEMLFGNLSFGNIGHLKKIKSQGIRLLSQLPETTLRKLSGLKPFPFLISEAIITHPLIRN